MLVFLPLIKALFVAIIAAIMPLVVTAVDCSPYDPQNGPSGYWYTPHYLDKTGSPPTKFDYIGKYVEHYYFFTVTDVDGKAQLNDTAPSTESRQFKMKLHMQDGHVYPFWMNTNVTCLSGIDFAQVKDVSVRERCFQPPAACLDKLGEYP